MIAVLDLKSYAEKFEHRHESVECIWCDPVDEGTRVLRDIRVPQIEYYVGTHCKYSNFDIDDCRCLHCLPLHTAHLPDISTLEDDERAIVRCRPGLGHKASILVECDAVLNEEDRPEFIVVPYCTALPPCLAKKPRIKMIHFKLE